jgi:hypothetical protein
MKLTILGNNSALPAYGRHPTAQLLEVNQQFHLIASISAICMGIIILDWSVYSVVYPC